MNTENQGPEDDEESLHLHLSDTSAEEDEDEGRYTKLLTIIYFLTYLYKMEIEKRVRKAPLRGI